MVDWVDPLDTLMFFIPAAKAGERETGYVQGVGDLVGFGVLDCAGPHEDVVGGVFDIFD